MFLKFPIIVFILLAQTASVPECPYNTRISADLRSYLKLSAKQASGLEATLKTYKETLCVRTAEIRAAKIKAAADPAASASRIIEQNNAEISIARTEARQRILAILSKNQLNRLERLTEPKSDDDRLSAEAARLDLIQPKSSKQNFGGIVSIFAPDTESQPNTEKPKQSLPKASSPERTPPQYPPPSLIF
jgi:hypothetical protein